MNLYLIENGEVTQVIDEVPEVDGIENILALAETPGAAAWAAELYDRGELQDDNRVWNGQTVVALKYIGEDDPQSCIARAEKAWGGPVAASRHLGVAYTTWAGYKSGARPMKEYIRRSILAHLELDRLRATSA